MSDISDSPEHPTLALLRSFPVDEHATVSLKRVLLQRAAFTELYTTTLLQPSLDLLLGEVCRIAAEGCEAPLAKVLEHQPKEGEFVLRAGFGWKPEVVGQARAAADPSNPAGEAFVTGRPVAVHDVRQRPDYHLPPIYQDHHIVSSTNVPIFGHAGFYGVLEVDRCEERPFDTLDSTYLAGIAGIVGDAVERVRRETALQAAHDARAALLREHHHRVRNNCQAIMARLERHARQSRTEDSRRRFEDVERRVFALASLYDHLIDTTHPEGSINFAAYLGALCDRMRTFYDTAANAIELVYKGADVDLDFDIDTATSLGTVINELVANAVEHAFSPAGGRIDLELCRSVAGVSIILMDNGSGFSAPPEGTGLSIVRQLVSAAGGSMEMTSDGGTIWTITLPPAPSGTARAT